VSNLKRVFFLANFNVDCLSLCVCVCVCVFLSIMGSGVKDYIYGRNTFIIYAPSRFYFKKYIKFR